MKKQFPAWVVLTVICVVAAFLLALTFGVTKDIIAENDSKTAEATRFQMIPAANVFDRNEDSGIYIGKDTAGQPVGYVKTVEEQGFGGKIEITVASDPAGVIQAISVGGSSFSETAGLGAKSKEPAFTDQFAGKTAPVALVKDGGEIDAITAATITSGAVIRGVNNAMEQIATEAGFNIKKEESAVVSLGNGVYAATGKGFKGPVYVKLTLDENGVITAIGIGDDQFAESASFGAKTQNEEFWGQYIGKTGRLVLDEDIDAVSGATITSAAVNDTVNQILLFVNDPETFAAGKQEEAAADAEDFALRTELGLEVSASERGFGGPVAVFITVSDDGKIAAIEIGDNDFNETEYYGERALEEDFANQFIGLQLPVSVDDIDALSGATTTTNAVINAINKAYGKIGIIPEKNAE